MFITNLCQVLGPFSVGKFLDHLAGKPSPFFLQYDDPYKTFLAIFLLYLGSKVFLTIGRACWRLTLARQTHTSAAMLKERIWDHVSYFSKESLQGKYTKGFLMNALTSDVGSARFIYGFTLVATIDVIFLGILTTLFMIQIDPMMTLWCYLVLFFVPILIRKISALEIRLYDLAQEYLGKFNDLTTQLVSTVRLQRLTHTEAMWRKKLVLSAEVYRERRLDAVYMSQNYTPAMGIGTIVSYIVLFSLGISAVFGDRMSVGNFIAMQGLVFLLQDPLLELGFIVSEWQKSLTSLRRLAEVYNVPKDPLFLKTNTLLPKSDLVYEIKNLSFLYHKHDTPLWDNLNLTIKVGDRLGVKGTIGSGKSTLLSILAGLERDYHGEIKFFGENLREFSAETLRSQITLVPQKPFLFADTIRANILLDQTLTDDEVWHYLEMSGLTEDFSKLPDRLDTHLGEWGINLSGGQKQRLTIARALAKRPSILLLDDCLSAVDTLTEEKILKNLDIEFKNKSVIWVAHRDSTLKYCHNIIHLGEKHGAK